MSKFPMSLAVALALVMSVSSVNAMEEGRGRGFDPGQLRAGTIEQGAVRDEVNQEELNQALLEADCNLDGMRKALDAGADIDTLDEYGANALYGAVSGLHFEAVKFLLDRGISVNNVDKSGLTPLDVCMNMQQSFKDRTEEFYQKALSELKKIEAILLEHGAKRASEL